MEAIISMVITAIILGIIFVIFSVTSERLLDFKKENEKINDINRLTYSVNKSIFESEEMKVATDEITFKTYNNEVITYAISEKYFTRTEGDFTDTFHLATKNIQLDILENKQKNIAYQRLKWSIGQEGKTMDFNFYKKLYAAELIKPLEK